MLKRKGKENRKSSKNEEMAVEEKKEKEMENAEY
jgi:hypothetical protein